MRALILVDLQNDFLPTGNLPVPGGDEVIPVANRLLAERARLFDYVVATQDWHPPGHKSFASSHHAANPGDVIDLNGLNQMLWPEHCVQGTFGAAFVSGLMMNRVDMVCPKGQHPEVDSYSGFFDNARRGETGLSQWLKIRGVRDLTILGLATDYCVRFTVLDALSEGFQVRVVTDGCRGVNVESGDDHRAIQAMQTAGAATWRLHEIMSIGSIKS
jgi:nicotinamidase/pyrazinamidase